MDVLMDVLDCDVFRGGGEPDWESSHAGEFSMTRDRGDRYEKGGACGRVAGSRRTGGPTWRSIRPPSTSLANPPSLPARAPQPPSAIAVFLSLLPLSQTLKGSAERANVLGKYTQDDDACVHLYSYGTSRPSSLPPSLPPVSHSQRRSLSTHARNSLSVSST